MDDILAAAAAQLQVQERQLQERNERLQIEADDNRSKLDSLEMEIKVQQLELKRLKTLVQQEEASRAEKKNFAQELRLRAGTRVKLDVGGVFFTTSVTTLLSVPDSMLAAMFSGRHEVEKDEEGRVFIDRDGKLFGYILQYLRDGDLDVSALPSGVKERLKCEAAFYCLPELEKKLSAVAAEGQLAHAVFLRIALISDGLECYGPDPLNILPCLPKMNGRSVSGLRQLPQIA